jgi:hypothetical protein
VNIKQSQMNVATLNRFDRFKPIGGLAGPESTSAQYLIERHPEGCVVICY